MFNCDNDIRTFHNKKVTLNNTQQSEMRELRNKNRKRLNRGLRLNGDPDPIYHQTQGSYAMHTMIQDDDYDYDIDDGVVFSKDELVGSQGANKTSLDARKMVCSALDDGSFTSPPSILKNCVRVNYVKGYHVDIPVYRELNDGELELASSEWKGSSPSEITEWYNEAVIEQSPNTTNGRQLRRITRLLKAYMNSRESWKNRTASGFVISILAVECYVPDGRDDVSLYETIEAVHRRLNWNTQVTNPVRGDMLTNGFYDARIKFLREKLGEALDYLGILFDCECSRLDALKGWRKVFRHQFWNDRVETEEDKINELAKQNKAALLRKGNAGLAITSGLTAAIGGSAAARVKQTQAYGG